MLHVNLMIIAIQTFMAETNLDDYLLSILIFIAVVYAFKVYKNKLVGTLKQRAESTKATFDDSVLTIFDQIKFPLVVVIALYISSLAIPFGESAKLFFSVIFKAAITLQIILLLQVAVNVYIEESAKKEKAKNSELKNIYSYLGLFLKILFWLLGALFFLSNIGLNVTSLIASLGVGGLAVALAVQDLLKDIISAVIIMVTKPFQVGNYIEFDNTQAGTVSKIGMKNTILKTADGRELIVTNNDVLNSRIFNTRERKRRTVNIALHLALNTSTTKLTKLKDAITEILKNEELVEKDTYRVNFGDFTQFSIDFDVVFHTKNNSFKEFVNAKDQVNFKIKEYCDKNKIAFGGSNLAGIVSSEEKK